MKDVLDRWCLIADYMKVSEKTASRYIKRGLPIKKDPAGHPVITTQEIDDWKKGKTNQRAA